MGRLGFFFNMNTCIGCGACQIACQDLHDLLPGEFLRHVKTLRVDTPDGDTYVHFSGACNHCEDAHCVQACRTGAMHKEQDGTVAVDASLCIGCGSCMWNCPNGAVSFSKTKGTAQKCDACKELREQGFPPACVLACPTRSLDFGDIDALTEKYGARRENLAVLPVADITDPNLLVKLPAKLSICGEKGAAHEEG